MLHFDEIQQNFLVWTHRKGPDCTVDLNLFVQIFFYTLIKTQIYVPTFLLLLTVEMGTFNM